MWASFQSWYFVCLVKHMVTELYSSWKKQQHLSKSRTLLSRLMYHCQGLQRKASRNINAEALQQGEKLFALKNRKTSLDLSRKLLKEAVLKMFFFAQMKPRLTCTRIMRRKIICKREKLSMISGFRPDPTILHSANG